MTLTPRPPSVRQRRDRRKLRIASFITLTGPAGIWGPAATNSTLLAVSEINQRGGILGREVEVVFHDAGGLIEDVVRAASDVVASDDADIIMGTHISAVRVALRKVVAGRIPYVYTSVYEGGERTPPGRPQEGERCEIILEKENISVSSDPDEICTSPPSVLAASPAVSSSSQETGETSCQ